MLCKKIMNNEAYLKRYKIQVACDLKCWCCHLYYIQSKYVARVKKQNDSYNFINIFKAFLDTFL